MKSRTLIVFICLISVALARADQSEVAFLRERVSVTTSSGVIGFAPGTRVIVVTRHGGMVIVKAEDRQFDVSTDQLITDSEAARKLNANDAAEQQAVQQRITEQEAARRAAQQQAYQSASPSNPRAMIEAQIHDVRKQRERLQIELDRVHAEQRDLPPPNSSVVRGHHIKSIRSSPNAEALANQEKDLRKQIDDLNYKERLLKLQLK